MDNRQVGSVYQQLCAYENLLLNLFEIRFRILMKYTAFKTFLEFKTA